MPNIIKVGINGAGGRVGKFLTYELTKMGAPIGALNDLVTTEQLVRSYRRKDSSHGTLDWEVRQIDGNRIEINGNEVTVYHEIDPGAIKWSNDGVRIVEECTGIFCTKEDAQKHLRGSVEKVIISSPANHDEKREIATIVMGVNHDTYEPEKHNILSNASCTTKALVVPLKVLLDHYIKIYGLLMDTVHAATNTQRTLDYLDMPGTLDNMIIHSTGAALGTVIVLPELDKLMDVFAYRVPTKDGSFANIYLVADTMGWDSARINKLFECSSANPKYKGRLAFISEKNVASSDIIGRTESAIIIGSQTKIIEMPLLGDGKRTISLVGIVSGYDNERGSAMDQALLTRYVIEKMR